MKQQRTVKEHLQEADQIERHVKEANALVERMRKNLEDARDQFKAIQKFDIPSGYRLNQTHFKHIYGVDDEKKMSVPGITKKAIEMIDQALGDQKD